MQKDVQRIVLVVFAVLAVVGLLGVIFISEVSSSVPAQQLTPNYAKTTSTSPPIPSSGFTWTGFRRESNAVVLDEGDSFSDLVTLVKEGKVVSLAVREENVTAVTVEKRAITLTFGEGDLIERLILLGVTEEQLDKIAISYSTPAPPWAIGLLFNLIIFGVLLIAGVTLMRRSSGGSGGVGPNRFGKSGAKVIGAADAPSVTFDDVAGLPEAKEELEEVVAFLKDPTRYMELGARIPKGVLLFGDPGCGKTLLAKAVAGEAGVLFFAISGSQFVEMFVGVGASRVRDLFKQAKLNAPSIVFVDEIDAVGSHRSPSVSGGGQEHDQTLNELLSQMDGFDPNTNVVVMAATNRPELLDPALTRPGRFDRHVAVDRPDVGAREKIFEVHVRGKPLTDDINLEILARTTPGFSGADIEAAVNEAAILAVRRNKKVISMSEFEEAIMKVVAGPERRSRVLSEDERNTIAYHEVGHAIAMHFTKGSDPVHKISIISRGLALGFTMPLPEGDRHLVSREWAFAQIVGLLGGRAAEEFAFGEPKVTSGASNDLQRATEHARQMVTEWGMSEKVGLRSLTPLPGSSGFTSQLRGEKRHSDHLAQTIDEEMKAILDRAYEKTRKIVSEHSKELERVVKKLLEVETMGREEFLRLVS